MPQRQISHIVAHLSTDPDGTCAIRYLITHVYIIDLSMKADDSLLVSRFAKTEHYEGESNLRSHTSKVHTDKRMCMPTGDTSLEIWLRYVETLHGNTCEYMHVQFMEFKL